MCVCVCVYVSMSVCICVFVSVCVYIYNIYIYIYIYTHTYISKLMYKHSVDDLECVLFIFYKVLNNSVNGYCYFYVVVEFMDYTCSIIVT